MLEDHSQKHVFSDILHQGMDEPVLEDHSQKHVFSDRLRQGMDDPC